MTSAGRACVLLYDLVCFAGPTAPKSVGRESESLIGCWVSDRAPQTMVFTQSASNQFGAVVADGRAAIDQLAAHLDKVAVLKQVEKKTKLKPIHVAGGVAAVAFLTTLVYFGLHTVVYDELCLSLCWHGVIFRMVSGV